MKTRTLFIIGLAFCAASPLPIAAQEKAVKEDAPKMSYVLQRRSSFNLPKETRPPFWPIGWKPRAGGEVVVVPQGPKVKLDENSFRVTSIVLGNPSVAIINSRTYAEGDFIRMPKTGPQLRVRVARILDGQVFLQHENEMFLVPLRRQQLNDKIEQEELFNLDR